MTVCTRVLVRAPAREERPRPGAGLEVGVAWRGGVGLAAHPQPGEHRRVLERERDGVEVGRRELRAESEVEHAVALDRPPDDLLHARAEPLAVLREGGRGGAAHGRHAVRVRRVREPRLREAHVGDRADEVHGHRGPPGRELQLERRPAVEAERDHAVRVQRRAHRLLQLLALDVDAHVAVEHPRALVALDLDGEEAQQLELVKLAALRKRAEAEGGDAVLGHH